MSASRPRPVAYLSMAAPADALRKTIALARIATGVFFVVLGQYKVFVPTFVDGVMKRAVEGWLERGQAAGFYRVFLAHVVLPQAEWFAYLIGFGELLIGLALIVGVWVRPAALAGGFYMLNLLLATLYAPGHDAPLWRYFAAQLEHAPLLLLFMIFFVARAGEVWGVDGLRAGSARKGERK